MAPSKLADDLGTLQTSIAAIKSLVEGYSLALQSQIPLHPVIESPPQPLSLLSDSCKLLRAQTTKLSLLILNKPFTPSAITYILKTCASGCLPAMMSALELCPANCYTHLLHNHIKSSLSRIMLEMLNLIASIPHDEYGIDPQSRDTLASTGVLWGECDQLVTLASDGIIPLAMKRSEDCHALLKDAIAELEDWDPNEEDSDTEEDLPSSSSQRHTQTSVDQNVSLVTTVEGLSISSPVDLRERSLKTLRTIHILYPALQKRRISTFPNITNNTKQQSLPPLKNVSELDDMVSATQRFTDFADEIAGALYEDDPLQLRQRLESLQQEGISCAERARKNWNGDDDEFTGWLDKWLSRWKDAVKEQRSQGT